MATIVAASGAAGNWTSGSAWVGGIAPTAGDDAQISTLTTSLTIDTGAVCRSADFTGFTGTLTHNGTTLTIGDATAGLSNIALNMPSGFTYAPNATANITFVSTSSTQQTISCDSGYSLPGVTINSASNGNYAITANLTLRNNVNFTFSKGTLHADGASDNSGLTHSMGAFISNNTSTRVLNLGTATINLTGTGTAWGLNDTSNLTLTASSSTLNISGASASFLSASAGGSSKTYGTVNFTGSGTPTISGTSTFGTLTRTGTAVKTDGWQINASNTITGTLTFTGNGSVNRLWVTSSAAGTAITLTTTGATVTATNTDFMDITLSTTKDFSAQTDIGDCGGNSGITFPASSTQTSTGTGAFTWSTHGWTTRVPLPQDDVVVSNAFSGSPTVTADMPRLGRSIDFSGSSGTFTLARGAVVGSIFGSLTLASNMASPTTGTESLRFRGRGNYSITSAGKTINVNNGFTILAPGGTYTLNDALNIQEQLNITAGSFNSSNFNITCSAIVTNGTITRSITYGTSTINLTSTLAGNIINHAVTTNLTFSGASATYIVSNTTSNTRTLQGGGLTYGTFSYVLAGSTGELDITGSNTFTTFNFSDASNTRTLKFKAATTNTFGTFNVNGTSGKKMVIDSITAANHTLTSVNQQSCDYLDIAHSVVDASPKWYAGANSTDEGTNTNWIFTGLPSNSSFRALMGIGI